MCGHLLWTAGSASHELSFASQGVWQQLNLSSYSKESGKVTNDSTCGQILVVKLTGRRRFAFSTLIFK